MRKLLLTVAVLGILASPAFGQQAIFRGKTTGALIKAGADGVADEATTGTVTSTGATTTGAATLNTDSGTITTAALTTAAGATHALTLTNSKVAATSKVFYSLTVGTATQGTPRIASCTPGTGTVVFNLNNEHATQAFNGTHKINFWVVK